MTKEELKTNFEKLKKSGVDLGKKGFNFAKEHPGETMLAVGAIWKFATKAYTKRTDTNHRDLDFWDPRAGVYARCRRKLSPREQIEVQTRYNSGESYRDILYSMHLLK